MRKQLIVAPVAILMLLFGGTVGMLRLMALHGVIDSAVWGSFYGQHGKLMIFAFLAPLIALERWVGSRTMGLHRAVDFMPGLIAAGGALKFFGSWLQAPIVDWLGTALLVAGSAIFLYLLERAARMTTVPSAFRLMQLGTVLLMLSAVLTLSYTISLPLNLLMLGFPVFTVLGERVELVRVTAPSFARWGWRALWIGAVGAAALIAGVLVPGAPWLTAVAALTLMAIAVPLWRAEPGLHRRGDDGLPRYMAAHLRWAYFWLAVGAAAALAFSLRPSHSLYDAASHSVALGFVLTMILGHAPVILPSILGRMVNERALVLGPLWLLQIGTMMRVGGYLARQAGLYVPPLIGWSGAVALAAVLALAAMLIRAVERPAWLDAGAGRQGAGAGRQA